MKVELPERYEEAAPSAGLEATIAHHVREHYIVTAWCARCLNVEPVDLAQLVARGWGERAFAALTEELRCSRCKSRAQVARRLP